MKLIMIRLLLPPLDTSTREPDEPLTQVAQTRASFAIQVREDLAIQADVSTLAPQTLFSTPQVVRRHDGSGVWMNRADGFLRGLEAKTKKIVTLLKDGNEIGSKIRSIFCGLVGVHGKTEEWFVRRGFD